MSTADEQPFTELPEALVEEMLNQRDALGENLSNSFQDLSEAQQENRDELREADLLKSDTELITTRTSPTSCGVDGAYAVERLLATDIVAIAGIAIEGLTPPSEESFWPDPHHYSAVLSANHSDGTQLVARAAMMCMETQLAASAPHNVVFLDGSLTTPLIYFKQGSNRLSTVDGRLAETLAERLADGITSYRTILSSNRSDKAFVGIPKYTSKREIAEQLDTDLDHEDRGLLSFTLRAGEYVGPVPINEPEREWYLGGKHADLQDEVDHIVNRLNDLYVVYYRPYSHMPALRLEISSSVATNNQQLGTVLEAVQIQSAVQGMMEPYPIYLADRMVKHLGTALPALRRTMTQQMSADWDDDIGNVYLAMHGYRTDSGQGRRS